jgi:UDP-N-acetylmuramoylalanine--D-glutamate ligase
MVGGSDKGMDYLEFGRTIAQGNVKQIILIGETGIKIAQAAESFGYDTNNVFEAQSLSAAVDYAAKIATSGDIVLLSPGSASFDRFPNYKIRGQQFDQLVKMKVGK